MANFRNIFCQVSVCACVFLKIMASNIWDNTFFASYWNWMNGFIFKNIWMDSMKDSQILILQQSGCISVCHVCTYIALMLGDDSWYCKHISGYPATYCKVLTETHLFCYVPRWTYEKSSERCCGHRVAKVNAEKTHTPVNQYSHGKSTHFDGIYQERWDFHWLC